MTSWSIESSVPQPPRRRRRAEVYDEPARRLVRCLDLFDEIEALDPTPHQRAELVRACQVEPGALREACLLRLRERVISRLVTPS